MKYLGLTRRAASLVPRDAKVPIFGAFFTLFRKFKKSHIARLVEIPCLTFFEEVFLADCLRSSSRAVLSPANYFRAATRFERRDSFREAVFLWKMPFETPRANSGCMA